MMKSVHHPDSGNTGSENYLFGYGILENQIQGLSRTCRQTRGTRQDIQAETQLKY